MLRLLNTIRVLNGKQTKGSSCSCFFFFALAFLSFPKLPGKYTLITLPQNRELRPSCLCSCFPLPSFYNFFPQRKHITSPWPVKNFLHFLFPVLTSTFFSRAMSRRAGSWNTERKIYKRCISRRLILILG